MALPITEWPSAYSTELNYWPPQASSHAQQALTLPSHQLNKAHLHNPLHLNIQILDLAPTRSLEQQENPKHRPREKIPLTGNLQLLLTHNVNNLGIARPSQSQNLHSLRPSHLTTLQETPHNIKNQHVQIRRNNLISVPMPNNNPVTIRNQLLLSVLITSIAQHNRVPLIIRDSGNGQRAQVQENSNLRHGTEFLQEVQEDSRCVQHAARFIEEYAQSADVGYRGCLVCILVDLVPSHDKFLG